MFYEEFVLFADPDDPRAEYKPEELKIYYYLENFTHEFDVIDTPTHEWLHGLFDWATEGEYSDGKKTTAEGDHFIMKIMSFC